MKRTRWNIVIAAALIALMLSACGVSKSQLCRSWYYEGTSYPAFTLYSDGTCEIDSEYGLGTWAVVNGNTFRLSNFYGETETATIKSVSSTKLVLTDGGYSSTFYSTPQ